MKRKASGKATYKYERLQAEMMTHHSFHLFPWALLCTTALAGVLCYVHLRSETEKNRISANALSRSVDERTRELDNLKMQQETLTSARYISLAVRRMGLDLQQAREGQVRRIAVRRKPPGHAPQPSTWVVAAE